MVDHEHDPDASLAEDEERTEQARQVLDEYADDLRKLLQQLVRAFD